MTAVKSGVIKQTSPKLLLMGYNGANNTGSEARLLAIIDDIHAVLGPEARITVPSLNPPNLRRYLKETPHLRIAPIPSIYFFTLRRLVKEHDVVLLVEGSCYMDTWTSALLWAFLWTSKCAHNFGKPCLAYAVDSGDLKPSNIRRVRREASKTDLIITRTFAAAKHLKSLGVIAPIEVTADTSFTFRMEPSDKNILQQVWPEATAGVVGLSVLDFYLWPVVVRLWGRKQHCYKWPYYFTRTRDRCQASEELAQHWASEADRIVKLYNKNIAIICMEQLDEPLASEVHKKMHNKNRARIFSSREYNTSEMTALLKSLELLVTSRYHAGVLSLEAQVPQVAIGHDTRLERFYQELGLYDNYFRNYKSPKLWSFVKEKVDELMTNPTSQREILKRGYNKHIARAKRNRKLLTEFLRSQGWSTLT